MRVFNLFPWRTLIRRIAHRKGFLDPFELLARLRRFSQPSEVQEPIELIRAGMVFHARGLVNTKVIQHNLDWIWPYWVVRQFSPEDPSFIPRAFSFSHVNLTHRNWTALGVPGCLELPIVDPRGLVTPHHDDWSVDHWFIPDQGPGLYPSTLEDAEQRLLMEERHTVETICSSKAARLVLRSEVNREEGTPVLRTSIQVTARQSGRLILSIRPCNPEGVQFIESVGFSNDGYRLDVGKSQHVQFARSPDELYTSNYEEGDVLRQIQSGLETHKCDCEAGLATAAAAYRINEGETQEFSYSIPIIEESSGSLLHKSPERTKASDWTPHMAGWAKLQVPSGRFVEIFESSKRTLALLSQTDILPGPYTYRRFWFRDACLIGNALLGLGQDETVRKSLSFFHNRQHLDGYFHSQEGEWDSNGQVLWLARQYELLSGNTGKSLDTGSILKAARWIDRKRRKTEHDAQPFRGLLPAGFSAEHLGPNDFYYWDDFWGAAGLRSAAAVLDARGESERAGEISSMASAFEKAILASIETHEPARVGKAIPAAPTRRMDSGAIGSLVADYPLALSWVPRERILATAEWLKNHSFHKGTFFQNMIHSGMNAYLTLDIAQTFLRAGDPRYWQLVCATAEAASPTGKWPEAVHPNTMGGCMGDGEHAWAAAEWCQMMRALFIDDSGHSLKIGQGLPAAWLGQEKPLSFGPTLTRWGPLSVDLRKSEGTWKIHVLAEWRGIPPEIEICLPEDIPAQLAP
ncbi:hypothetical protein G0Q06_04920 [Puniceicoccales bacterium CK1056]|uniref:Uncharacterized protein n=1 Tax=Oceanipulchritudo coccoides TaxID=2706888 RepID=A0A6B2M0B4_9BACT|nr:hypothetical protein [Oceanipulchritudo coccoides]NDV61786.1 hypothetical protein [Oceanipulchritudo coccoides]